MLPVRVCLELWLTLLKDLKFIAKIHGCLLCFGKSSLGVSDSWKGSTFLILQALELCKIGLSSYVSEE